MREARDAIHKTRATLKNNICFTNLQLYEKTQKKRISHAAIKFEIIKEDHS